MLRRLGSICSFQMVTIRWKWWLNSQHESQLWETMSPVKVRELTFIRNTQAWTTFILWYSGS